MSDSKPPVTDLDGLQEIELKEWIDSLEYVIRHGSAERVQHILHQLNQRADEAGVALPFSANTPYRNTIPRERQPEFPGDLELEQRITSLMRWNAMAMVVRANREEDGIGGHISTYASSATLYEIAFNHFIRGKDGEGSGDQVYIQGHASPGIYARAFLEGRLSEDDLKNFRRELRGGKGLTSYPHPWLMPDFWEFPTVSMGLAPIMSIYQARFNRYLEDRGLAENTGRVWAFLGDGETDEPETLGAIALASREKLDNLLWVVNCNLQRLDGPVRGNGKIIQELEGTFRGAGWNVIKVVWGSNWDDLLARDTSGALLRRLGEAVDGDFQKFSVESGAYIREKLFGTSPELLELVEDLSDDELRNLGRGGHDPEKVYAAYHAAVNHRDAPSVVLAKTIKGYGLGEAGEGKNVTHQQKKLNEAELLQFKKRFQIPISDKRVAQLPFYRPEPDSAETRYLLERRRQLDGFVPIRDPKAGPTDEVSDDLFAEFRAGTKGSAASTTMVFVRLLSKLLRDKGIGARVVPIIPDEARTFGMEALFRQVGIYSHVGQTYDPVDRETLLYYKEAVDGQILEEGITEAGSMSSLIAAGTTYATHGVQTIPFFIYYSMFGFQRIGDLIWAAQDMRCRGFLIGGTAGRTTLAGEGLQHQDGHSHLLAYPYPTVMAYDPAFAYEIATIIQEGLRRMYVEQEDLLYYLTVGNEPYPMPPMPGGDEVRDGILRGLYRFKPSTRKARRKRVQLLGSGAIMNQVLEAQALLEEEYGVAANVWSVTSYKELFKDALQVERWNRLHPGEEPRRPYVTEALGEEPGTIIAASDYTKALPYSIARWIPGGLEALGTDGFGRSESRAALRDFFEVDARHLAVAALAGLHRHGAIPGKEAAKAIRSLGIDAERVDPLLR